MANNHTCSTFTYYDREFNILETSASNIQLVNILQNGEGQKISNTSYYGMNASYFDTNGTTKNKLLNIAFQDGDSVGSGVTSTDGYNNEMGTGLIYWTGSTLGCADGVTSSSSSMVPKTSGSWAQGGFHLYLCDSNWSNKTNDITSAGAKCGILINKSTKKVYLFMCKITSTTTSDLRYAMMQYAGLSDGGSKGYWDAIMVDGGLSAQIRGDGLNSSVTFARGIPQIIALKNKT